MVPAAMQFTTKPYHFVWSKENDDMKGNNGNFEPFSSLSLLGAFACCFLLGLQSQNNRRQTKTFGLVLSNRCNVPFVCTMHREMRLANSVIMCQHISVSTRVLSASCLLLLMFRCCFFYTLSLLGSCAWCDRVWFMRYIDLLHRHQCCVCSPVHSRLQYLLFLHENNRKTRNAAQSFQLRGMKLLLFSPDRFFFLFTLLNRTRLVRVASSFAWNKKKLSNF